MTQDEAFEAELAKLPTPMQTNIRDAMTRDESLSRQMFAAGWSSARATPKPQDDFPPLPPADPKQMLGYEAIRYIAGYPESYVHQYAKAYVLADRAAREKK